MLPSVVPLPFSRRQLVRGRLWPGLVWPGVAKCRCDHNRLGFACRVSFVRLFSRFPARQPLGVCDGLLNFVAMQQEAVNTQHVHPQLGGLTPAQHRRGLWLQKLPARFVVPTERLPLAEGRVTFIRRVSVAGTVAVLSQTFRVGKRLRGLCLRLVVDSGRGRLTAYLNGRVLKRWPYKLLGD